MFGNVIDGVLWAAHCPVAVTRLLIEPNKIQRVLVPVENLSSEAVRLIQFAQALGDSQVQITVLLGQLTCSIVMLGEPHRQGTVERYTVGLEPS